MAFLRRVLLVDAISVRPDLTNWEVLFVCWSASKHRTKNPSRESGNGRYLGRYFFFLSETLQSKATGYIDLHFGFWNIPVLRCDVGFALCRNRVRREQGTRKGGQDASSTLAA